MAFSSKIDDGKRLMLFQQACHQCPVSNVSLHKNVIGMLGQARQILEITGISQFIQIDDPPQPACDPFQNEIGAYKAGTTGDEYRIVQNSLCVGKKVKSVAGR